MHFISSGWGNSFLNGIEVPGLLYSPISLFFQFSLKELSECMNLHSSIRAWICSSLTVSSFIYFSCVCCHFPKSFEYVVKLPFEAINF